MHKKAATLRDVKAELIGDSIERRKLVEKLIVLVRAEERDRVLSVTSRARERGEA